MRPGADEPPRPGTAGAGIHLGAGRAGPVRAPHQQAVLVLGPPRSGKTSSVVVPSVLCAPGAVVSTSTKPDVLAATARARRRSGPCLLYDPSGTVDVPPGVERVRWSPVPGALVWDDALVMARSLVGATRPAGTGTGTGAGLDHWTERAESLLGPLLHAAALEGAEFATVLSWVDKRQAGPALGALETHGAAIAGDLLAGIAATEAREQSGIWSTASGVLAGFRTQAALESTRRPDFDAAAFCDGAASLFVCATGRRQALSAALVVGVLADVRAAAYARAARARTDERASAVLFALDEVANIAPIPDLPAMVSEGGGQGVLTLACLQDLSQARGRWGEAAEGFLSLFGTTVVLPGIGDVRTLEALSSLAGEADVPARSVTVPAREPPGLGRAAAMRLLGRRSPEAGGAASVTTAVVQRPRLPVDVAGQGRPGMALVVDERNRMGWVHLTPWFATEPWRSLALGPRTGPERAGPERVGPERVADPGRDLQRG